MSHCSNCSSDAVELRATIDTLNAQLDAANERGAALVVERDALKAQIQSLEYELKDKRGQFDDANRCADRYSAERHAAVEHLDEFTGLGLVDGIKAMRVALITARAELDRLKAQSDEMRHELVATRIALITARAELAATKAGADHLQTSLQRALADLAAQDRTLTATANELRAERDEARGQLARVRATVLEELAKLGVTP